MYLLLALFKSQLIGYFGGDIVFWEIAFGSFIIIIPSFMYYDWLECMSVFYDVSSTAAL